MAHGMTELETLKGYYDSSVEGDARRLQERDRDYYDNKQWTAAEEAELKKRKQPVVIENLIKPKIDNMMGLERSSRTDPKAYPRTPEHTDAAQAATDAIRYVLDNNDFDYIRSEVGENIFIEGEGGAIVEFVDDEIKISHIPWDRLIKDRHSRRRDGKDAKFMGQGIWMDQEDAIALFGEEHREHLIPADGYSLEMEDRPGHGWFDTKRNRVFVVELYYRSKVWRHAVFTGAGIIYDAESEYKGEDGKPSNPIEISVAFMDRDNNVYGPIRQLISPQDEVNKRRSKFLHAINNRQTSSEKGAFDDINLMKREMNKPDGHVEYNKGFAFDVLGTGDISNGQFTLLQDSRSMMNSVGANDAITGKAAAGASGRAIQARQQAGVLELGPVFDTLRSWQKRIYRQVWLRIRQHWTDQRWIRVTDNEDNLKFVGLNQPITVRQALEESGRAIPPDFNDPRLDQIVEVRNMVAEMDVDIILEDAPDTITLQNETFEAFTQAVQASGTQIPLEIWLDLMPNVPNKAMILDKLKGGEMTPEEQQAAQAQAQAEAQEREQEKALAMQAMQLDFANKDADTKSKMAKAAKDSEDARSQGLENEVTEMSLSNLLQANQGF